MPNIRDVAKACGVSPMTVSYVLNNKRDQISEETRQRVLQTIRKMRYRPIAVERDGEVREVCTLGVVAGVDGDSLIKPGYYSAVVQGIFGKADHLRHSVLLFSHHLLHNDTERSIRLYCDGRCDGLLVLAPRVESNLVAVLHERGLPFVLIGDTGDNDDVSYIDVDNRSAAKSMVNHLIELGHRRIAFVGGPHFVRSANQRREGYLDAMAEHGLPVNPLFLLDDVIRDYTLKEPIRQLMRLSAQERPTAVFAWNDGFAMPVLSGIEEVGLRIPHDVSVMGFDDDITVVALRPDLATVRQPFHELGGRAVEILLEQIHATDMVPQREFLPVEFLYRGTVAPPAPNS